MSIKINVYMLSLILVSLFSINLSAQYKISEIKKFAFNRCLHYNYSKIDSTFYDVYKDGSGVQSSVIGKFIEDQDLKNKVNDYTIAKTNEYYSKKITFTLSQVIKIPLHMIVLIFMNQKS